MSVQQSYRALVRGVYTLTRKQPRSVRLNLLRTYREQFKHIAHRITPVELLELQSRVERTLTKLVPALTNNLSSMSYHHLPPPPHLLRSSHPSKKKQHTIEWNAQDPAQAMRDYDALKRRQKQNAELHAIEAGVLHGLSELRSMAEGADAILLGRSKS